MTKLAYFQPIEKLVSVGKKRYMFQIRHTVSLCEVDDEDVPAMLAIKGGCCGRRQQVCHIANENEIKMWELGTYR